MSSTIYTKLDELTLLVQEAKQLGTDLAFEDLTNIRESLNKKPRSKTERRKTNNWAFYQLRLFVGYKANIAGVKVVFVPAAYTSQTSDAEIFTRLRVSRTVMEKFLSVGIVVLNMMLILMQLIILLLWGSL